MCDPDSIPVGSKVLREVVCQQMSYGISYLTNGKLNTVEGIPKGIIAQRCDVARLAQASGACDVWISPHIPHQVIPIEVVLLAFWVPNTPAL